MHTHLKVELVNISKVLHLESLLKEAEYNSEMAYSYSSSKSNLQELIFFIVFHFFWHL